MALWSLVTLLYLYYVGHGFALWIRSEPKMALDPTNQRSRFPTIYRALLHPIKREGRATLATGHLRHGYIRLGSHVLWGKVDSLHGC
jgi:hypothetical protein